MHSLCASPSLDAVASPSPVPVAILLRPFTSAVWSQLSPPSPFWRAGPPGFQNGSLFPRIHSHSLPAVRYILLYTIIILLLLYFFPFLFYLSSFFLWISPYRPFCTALRPTPMTLSANVDRFSRYDLLQNALEFSQIFLNPLAVVLTAVLKPHGSYKLLF
jgi:hypothetical protein